MADLYRKSALERISSPEQLDKALTVSSPMSWLALGAITVLIVISLLWSIFGRIPVTVKANGVISSATSTNAIFIEDSATIQALHAQPGVKLNIGDPVLAYRVGTGETKTLYSNHIGVVSEVLVNIGDSVVQGSEVIRVSPKASADQVVVCFVASPDAKKLELLKDLNVYLDSVNRQTDGHMQARIINIDKYPATAKGMSYVLASDNNLAAQLNRDGAAVVAVTCELYPPKEGIVTASGFYWSNEKGYDEVVTNGSTLSVEFFVDEIPPISKLFTRIQEIWGGK